MFEDRNEPNFPRGKIAQKLVQKIVKTNCEILYSDLTLLELSNYGLIESEIIEYMKPLKRIIIFTETTEKEDKKAKDVSVRRGIPKGDALHALIARDNKATMLTYDKHFEKLRDIARTKKPTELI